MRRQSRPKFWWNFACSSLVGWGEQAWSLGVFAKWNKRFDFLNLFVWFESLCIQNFSWRLCACACDSDFIFFREYHKWSVGGCSWWNRTELISSWMEVLPQLREERKSESGDVPRRKSETEAAAASYRKLCQLGNWLTFGGRRFRLLCGWCGRFYFCLTTFFWLFVLRIVLSSSIQNNILLCVRACFNVIAEERGNRNLKQKRLTNMLGNNWELPKNTGWSKATVTNNISLMNLRNAKNGLTQWFLESFYAVVLPTLK